MVFEATFNNIPVISLRSVVLVEPKYPKITTDIPQFTRNGISIEIVQYRNVVIILPATRAISIKSIQCDKKPLFLVLIGFYISELIFTV